MRPMLAGRMGRPLEDYIATDQDGRGFTMISGLSEPLTQAMLVVNSHESAPANGKGMRAATASIVSA